MADSTDDVTFSVEREGKEYDVRVEKQLILEALSQPNADPEAIAGWFQNHSAELGEMAHRRIDADPSSDGPIRITTADWGGR